MGPTIRALINRKTIPLDSVFGHCETFSHETFSHVLAALPRAITRTSGLNAPSSNCHQQLHTGAAFAVRSQSADDFVSSDSSAVSGRRRF
jgi:hypothetical protein